MKEKIGCQKKTNIGYSIIHNHINVHNHGQEVSVIYHSQSTFVIHDSYSANIIPSIYKCFIDIFL